MNKALIFLRREFGTYWLSPIGYVVLAIFLIINGYFSMASFRSGMQVPMIVQGMFNMWLTLFVIFLPAITMRLWAEERLIGTLELLLTYPVRVCELVLGKFLGALAFVVVMLALTLTVPITVSYFVAPGGSLDWAMVVSGYLGALLMSSAILAIGLFWSSLTGNQIVAYLVSVISVFALNMTTFLQFEGFPRWVKEFLGWIGLGSHFQPFYRGLISSQGIVYFLAVTAFFLWLNAMVLVAKKRRG